jgi:hypothetical protein
MNRINAFRTIAETSSALRGNINALIFAAVLIVCSVTVGCSSSKGNNQSKLASSTNPIPVIQPQPTIAATPIMQPESKPAAKKIVHKKPATVNYTDKTTGVTFEYPRRYAIETGEAAQDLVLSNPIPMNFVQPGGVALAAVELPETSFANTDFSSAFFNVSVHKSLTADQCTQFAVPQPKVVAESTTPAMSTDASTPSAATQPIASADQASAPKAASSVQSSDPSSSSKLMLGDLELRATEAVSGEGTRQSDSKYFHVFQNGSCYEFALNVTTVASDQGVTKHVDRDKVFNRLEQILSTVKINPVAVPEVTAEAPAATPAETPAQ